MSVLRRTLMALGALSASGLVLTGAYASALAVGPTTTTTATSSCFTVTTSATVTRWTTTTATGGTSTTSRPATGTTTRTTGGDWPTTSSTTSPSLVCAGAITGRLLDRGRPVAGAGVAAQGLAPNWGSTDAAGRYRIDRLRPGTYTLQFTLPGGLIQYHPGVLDPAQATTVTVAPLQTTAAGDTAVVAHGSIGGRVLNSAGAPAADAYVMVYDEAMRIFLSATADAQGRYELPYVAPDRYKVGFSSGLSDHGFAQWAHRAFGMDKATVFTIRAGRRTVVDDRLVAGGKLVVEYRRADGTPVVGAELEARLPDGSGAYLSTDENGHAERALPPATFALLYALPDGSGSRWWRNAESEADATPVRIRTGVTTTLTITP